MRIMICVVEPIYLVLLDEKANEKKNHPKPIESIHPQNENTFLNTNQLAFVVESNREKKIYFNYGILYINEKSKPKTDSNSIIAAST